MNDKNENALKSLEWLRGKEYDSASELAVLKEENEQQKMLNVSIRDALSRPATVKALIISIGLMFFQQLSGINAVIFYTTDIFNVRDDTET
jgi:Sugar (and other) transporter